MSLPGLSLAFKPHPHRYAAVARIVGEPGVGLSHEVGDDVRGLAEEWLYAADYRTPRLRPELRSFRRALTPAAQQRESLGQPPQDLYRRQDGIAALMAAIASFGTSLGLVIYDSWFLRKTRAQ